MYRDQLRPVLLFGKDYWWDRTSEGRLRLLPNFIEREPAEDRASLQGHLEALYGVRLEGQ